MNDGKIDGPALKLALLKVTSDIDQETLDRFVRFLERDIQGKIDYVAFLEKMSDISNKDHNPFKQVVQRISFFLDSNKQSVASIIKRLAVKSGSDPDVGVSTSYFAEFLKAKIDKKRSEEELTRYAYFIDIDKDGFVSEIDLKTCLDNLNSDIFFRDSGEALAVSAFSSQRKFFPAG
jgi:Ca2+-binding EF-hand superfamily protein